MERPVKCVIIFVLSERRVSDRPGARTSGERVTERRAGERARADGGTMSRRLRRRRIAAVAASPQSPQSPQSPHRPGRRLVRQIESICSL